MVVIAGCGLRGRGFDSLIGIFFHSFFFSVSFFPLSFSFMLAPPLQCSSIFSSLVKIVLGFGSFHFWEGHMKFGQNLVCVCVCVCVCMCVCVCVCVCSHTGHMYPDEV